MFQGAVKRKGDLVTSFKKAAAPEARLHKKLFI